MSPVALYSAMTATTSIESDKQSKSRLTPIAPVPAPTSDIPRRPSPWHEIAHSLSTTSIAPPTSALDSGYASASRPFVASRRISSPNLTSGPLFINDSNTYDRSSSPPSVALSTSQALRDWEERLKSPESDARRHQLVHPPTPIHQGQGQGEANAYAYGQSYPYPPRNSNTPSRSSPSLIPKLAAERDKEGHIEYKLKLIEPSPERFGKLVTQMMWRLKQGKNEAIYELGLADDGTVVGLTRAEMDASLKTLELMASELGATVMILREIVLSVHPPLPPQSTLSPSDVNASSGLSYSLSSSTYSSIGNDNDGDSHWPVRRPDLNALGQPRKGTRVLGGDAEEVEVEMDVGKIRKKPVVRGQMGVARQVIFDPRDLEDGDRDTDTDGEDDLALGPNPNPTSRSSRVARNHMDRSNTDDDIPPFHLDMDESFADPDLSPSTSSPISDPGYTRRRRRKQNKNQDQNRSQSQTNPVETVSDHTVVKSNAKRLRAAQKREARRLDLLRGDGMDPNWARRGQSLPEGGGGFFDTPNHSATISPQWVDTIAQHGLRLPYQPTRPSSLRLSAAPDRTTPGDAALDPRTNPDRCSRDEDDESMWSLSHMPLDSLSLSFANIHVEDISPASSPSSSPSPSSDTEYAHTSSSHRLDQAASRDSDPSFHARDGKENGDGNENENDETIEIPKLTARPLTGQERICVEALVVRKVQHGHGADGGGEDEEECGWGGEDDVWGMGVDD